MKELTTGYMIKKTARLLVKLIGMYFTEVWIETKYRTRISLTILYFLVDTMIHGILNVFKRNR